MDMLKYMKTFVFKTDIKISLIIYVSQRSRFINHSMSVLKFPSYF